MYKTLRLTLEEGIARIGFNRPQAMNSFNQQMADELFTVTEQVLNDQTVRVVLLYGEGELFMAGGDINFFHQKLAELPQGVLSIVRCVNASILNLQRMAKPVVACVHGSVAGIGMSFMLAADLVLAAADTQFVTAYSHLALSPDGGMSYFLPQLIGTKRAAELLLLADKFDAKQAEAWGLINWVVPKAELTTATQQLLQRLATGPTLAYANIKRLLYQALANSLPEQLEAEAELFAQASMSADFKAAVNAFKDKKPVQFEGS